MQQPRMIVLALVGSGLRYGFEMEEFAQSSQMRQWAKIGMSTIYKALSELERDGAIAVEVEKSDRGPARKSYSLTAAGRSLMVEMVAAALASESSVYSDRVAGLVFSPLLGQDEQQSQIEDSIRRLKDVSADLAEREAALKDQMGRIIVRYYREIYAAEIQAMEAVLADLT